MRINNRDRRMTSGLQCLKIFVAVAAVFAVATRGFPTNTRRKDVWLLKSVPGVSPYVLMPENTTSYSQSFSITKMVPIGQSRRWVFTSRRKNFQNATLTYDYQYDKLVLDRIETTEGAETIGIILIHPIGVGISKWYYERLFNSFTSTKRPTNHRYVLISPDLLGSGSGCDPIVSFAEGTQAAKYLPLLNISDWADQLIDLMASNEEPTTEQRATIDRWCVVANGGCSPLALQVAEKSMQPNCLLKRPISNVIISSTPRLPFFLNSTDPSKTRKAYNRLCGVVGRTFWWYACRKRGRFIQKFSEKNLVADPANLGETWQSNCYEIATANRGMSRYSTFAFLAGTLQDGCKKSLDTLKSDENGATKIDVIRGRDIRRNRARSWFWQKPSKKSAPINEQLPTRQTFGDYVKQNGNGGKESVIGGRVSLAHEDAPGYCNSILSFLEN